jgi:catechol 2,3-dioxygenase-like lactoylglutathione lyase family enzyme
MKVVGLDHVQVAMPTGAEAEARAFYGGILGLEEIPKPAELAGRGGLWYAVGTLQLHLGVEVKFRAARKAHPAFQVNGLHELTARLSAAGYEIGHDIPLPGMERVHVADPFGNRIELIERKVSSER